MGKVVLTWTCLAIKMKTNENFCLIYVKKVIWMPGGGKKCWWVKCRV